MGNTVIGIDEVGRGPLAGPVVVCAVAIERKAQIAKRKALGPLRDSKKLTAHQREDWYVYLTNHPKISFAVARVYPRQIERRNIARAANIAAARAFARLVKSYRLSVKQARIYLDGGLYIRDRAWSEELGARTVVKGDEKIPVVAAASIIAKVTRDRFMVRLAKRYPGYDLERHKGYGTRVHLAAIRRLGPTPAHRRTFLA